MDLKCGFHPGSPAAQVLLRRAALVGCHSQRAGCTFSALLPAVLRSSSLGKGPDVVLTWSDREQEHLSALHSFSLPSSCHSTQGCHHGSRSLILSSIHPSIPLAPGLFSTHHSFRVYRLSAATASPGLIQMDGTHPCLQVANCLERRDLFKKMNAFLWVMPAVKGPCLRAELGLFQGEEPAAES